MRLCVIGDPVGHSLSPLLHRRMLDRAGLTGSYETVQYLAGHKNSKTTMDIYAKIKYNKPEELLPVINAALRPVAMS